MRTLPKKTLTLSQLLKIIISGISLFIFFMTTKLSQNDLLFFPLIAVFCLCFLYHKHFGFLLIQLISLLIYENLFLENYQYTYIKITNNIKVTSITLFTLSYVNLLLCFLSYLFENHLKFLFNILNNKVAKTCATENILEIMKHLDVSPLRPILVIDDDPDFLNLIKRSLEKEGHHVMTAQDAMAGITMAKNANVELILLDINMPHINGVQACEMLRENPSTKSAKIIGMSSTKYEELRNFDDSHFKPDGLINLIQKI